MDFAAYIRDIPDFPKPGIVFKDITPLLADGKVLSALMDQFEERYKGQKIDAVVGIEARGFIFGAALADRLKSGFVPVRKKGKLPYKTASHTYDSEYGTDTIEMHEDAVKKGATVLVVDDVLATGGTAAATVKLLEDVGAEVVELAFVLELEFLKGREKLVGQPIYSVMNFS